MPDKKVVLEMVLSLDGFATSPDGTHEWMFEYFGEDGGEWNLRALDEAGTHAMGDRDPHDEKPKAVFSRTLRSADWGPIAIGAGLGPFADLDHQLNLEPVEERRFASGARGWILVPRA